IGHLNSGNTDYKKKQYLPNGKSKDVFDYYAFAIEKLKDIKLTSNKVYSLHARKSLISRMQEQITEGATDVMLNTIEELVQSEGAMSDDIRQKLTQINSEKYRLDEKINK